MYTRDGFVWEWRIPQKQTGGLPIFGGVVTRRIEIYSIFEEG